MVAVSVFVGVNVNVGVKVCVEVRVMVGVKVSVGGRGVWVGVGGICVGVNSGAEASSTEQADKNRKVRIIRVKFFIGIKEFYSIL